MTDREGTVFVVDDDLSVRRGLERLLRAVGYRVETYASAEQFIDRENPGGPGCLVLDVRMPGKGGLDVQQFLVDTGALLPIIFITGHGDVPTVVRAMKAGAVDFLTKPFRDQDMLDAVTRAIEADRMRRSSQQATSGVRDSYGRLSPREREVMEHVVRGRRNKQIAADLRIAMQTVKQHRGKVMEKMEVSSVADLVRAVEAAGAVPATET